MRSFTILFVSFLAAVVRTGNAFQIPQKQEKAIFHQTSNDVIITTKEAESRKAMATTKRCEIIATIGCIFAVQPANAFEINAPGGIVMEISPLDVVGYGSFALGVIYGYSYWYYYDKNTQIEKAAAEKKATMAAKKKATAAANKAKKEKEAAPVVVVAAAKKEGKKVEKTTTDEKAQPVVVAKKEQNNEVYVPKEEELELPEVKMAEMNAASKSEKVSHFATTSKN